MKEIARGILLMMLFVMGIVFGNVVTAVLLSPPLGELPPSHNPFKTPLRGA